MRLCLAIAGLLSALVTQVTCGKIEHVIVLMMENRAFDHMLGCSKEVDPEIEGCLPSMGRMCANPFDPLNASSPWMPISFAANVQEFGCTNQRFERTTRQVYGTDTGERTMTGFLRDCGGDVAPMTCFTHDRVPAISTLAREYALMNRYFASVPAQTFPNRLYLFAGSSVGYTQTNKTGIIIGSNQRSIFNQMDETKANVSWSVYSNDLPSPMYLQYPRDFLLTKFHPWSQFATDAAAGKLSNFVMLDPTYDGDHAEAQEAPDNVGLGDRFIKRAYEIIRSSPLWEKTLFVLTYDEHGGFFDHVPPPENVPSPDDIPCFDCEPVFHYNRLGPRVPMILISPWVKRGLKIGEPQTAHYEHSSLLQTVRNLFNMTDMPPLTKRDAWAAPYDWVVNTEARPRSDCPMTVPMAPT